MSHPRRRTGAGRFQKVVRLKSRRRRRRGRQSMRRRQGVSSPVGVRSGERAVPLPRNFFCIFCVKIMIRSTSLFQDYCIKCSMEIICAWCYFCRLYSLSFMTRTLTLTSSTAFYIASRTTSKSGTALAGSVE